MRVVGADSDMSAADRARRAGVRVLELNELLTEADVVSLCASRRFGAAPLVGSRELRQMSPEALLVNAARSSLVDTAAVIAALREGRLSGYGVDDCLPAADGQAELAAQGRLLQTGHSAWWRDEAMSRGADHWGERLIAAAIGSPQDVVTWPGLPALVAA
jgi:phosphoglycerate dehydrogenase-like enzyme